MNQVVERESTAVAQVDQNDSNALMRIIERAATSSDFDVAKLQQLLEMRERWEATEARKAFTVAMTEFKADPPSILKSKLVNIPGGAKFAHATLADVVDGVCAALSRHGLSHKWETSQSDERISVTCTITHRMGHKESVTLTASPDDSGKKNSIQQIASTVTYLERYTLMAATGLAARDMDDDARGANRKAEANPDPAGKAALEKCGSISSLQSAWKELTAAQRVTLGAVKDECKARIEAADREAAKA